MIYKVSFTGWISADACSRFYLGNTFLYAWMGQFTLVVVCFSMISWNSLDGISAVPLPSVGWGGGALKYTAHQSCVGLQAPHLQCDHLHQESAHESNGVHSSAV